MTQHRYDIPQPRVNAEGVTQGALLLGHAVWHLQQLEDVLASHLVLTNDLQPGSTREALEGALEKRRRLTFGQLLQVPELQTKLSNDLLLRLGTLKSDRNWLIHQSRRDIHVDFYTEAGSAAAIAKIDAISVETQALVKAIVNETDAFLQACGLVISQHLVVETLRHWQKGQRHPNEIGNT